MRFASVVVALFGSVIVAACTESVNAPVAPVRPRVAPSATAAASVSPQPSSAAASETASPAASASPPNPARIAVGAFASPEAVLQGPRTIDELESAIGRRLDYDMHYGDLASPFPSSGEIDDLARGRTPLESIACADDAAIVSGKLDGKIDTLASAMKAFGATIELRYCYEMNLPKHALTPAAFVAEWDRVHDRFVAAGATNVRFLWCPSNENKNPSSGVAYYPGDAYVDDAGYDAYDDASVGFQALMDTIYPFYAPIGKPIVVSETGASRGTTQPTYLDAATAELIRTRYPAIKAIVYFDRDGGRGEWSFSPAGLSAFAAFAQAAR